MDARVKPAHDEGTAAAQPESSSTMARLAGRTAIVTGGAKGIGRHYSHALAGEGAQVMIADIADGSDVAAEIAAKHGSNSVTSMMFDVSDEKQCKAVVDKTIERFGKIDILVNNAALYATLPTLKVTEIDVDLWDRVMAVNIRGPFLMVKHVAPHMMARRSGKIINIGSGSAARGLPDFSHYVTSKGAVTSFTRSISRELGDYGICVNTLAPGFTLSDTGLTNTVHVDQSRAIAVQRRAIKRDEYPEDILGTLIFLASSDSDFMTGQVLAVDGGTNNT
jgi:NAD(P)-dependent dehydrogenase (short-subunit alcohol dehydrogenase family)